MGKQFGTGVTIKPTLTMPQLEKLHAEMCKKYQGNMLVYSSPGNSTNVQAGLGIEVTGDQLFSDVKDSLKRAGFDVAERKEGNKRYILIK
ncbi:MAG: hypothetical protein K0R18_301 [Bacillales bacterium]|jgi:hypothetical protein|nr:hypothetical protein [Bacillales bacterium]